MAIESRIRRGYAWRLIIIALVCLVLGLWGVYDYAVDIPRRQTLHERLELLNAIGNAMETEQVAGELSPEAQAATKAAQAEWTRLASHYVARAFEGAGELASPDEFREVLESVAVPAEDLQWMNLLDAAGRGLASDRSLPLTGQPREAYELVQGEIEEIGSVTAPAKYDRLMQWAFILSLPCTPWLLWMYVVARRQTYRLEEDGTLVLPEGRWAAGEIRDIDMSRWMAKSVATVVHRDGTRVALDDYKFQDLHRIVGAVASRLHPDEWSADARPIEAGAEGSETAANPSPEPTSAPADA